MLKKILAALMCSTVAAAGLVSCGKEIKVDESSESNASVTDDGQGEVSDDESGGSSGSEQSGSSETSKSDASIANFTAPEDGEKIIIMNIKDYGEVKIKLFPEYADKGVENFVELAKEGYYDGLTFHRVISDFMIQGGDPLGTGTGGESIWGGKFDGGTDPRLIHAAGAVAYANSGSTATNGSQFYIVTGTVYEESDLEQLDAYYQLGLSDEAMQLYTTVGGTPWLDGGYTVFGQVFDGLDVIFEIQNVATDAGNDKPLEDVVMESVKVGEYDGGEIKWYISDYAE